MSDPELASLHMHTSIGPLLKARGTFTLDAMDASGVGVVPKAWAVHRRWVGGHGGGVVEQVVRVVDLVTGKVSFAISTRDSALVDRFFAIMGFTAEGVTRKAWQGEFDVSWSAQFVGGKARSVRESSSLSDCPDYGDVIITLVR